MHTRSKRFPTVTLGQKQELFARCHASLLLKAFQFGYEVRQRELGRGKEQARHNAFHCGTCGDAKRGHGNEVRSGVADHAFHPIGIEDSLHCDFLAIDLYLRKPGGAMLWAPSNYRALGEYWESLHELCYWGGRTDKPGDRLRHDAGHFSITDRGRQ
jgi:hypothetical protein